MWTYCSRPRFLLLVAPSPILSLLPFKRTLVVSTRIHCSSMNIASKIIRITSQGVRINLIFSVVILLSLRDVPFCQKTEESCLVFSSSYSCPHSFDLKKILFASACHTCSYHHVPEFFPSLSQNNCLKETGLNSQHTYSSQIRSDLPLHC